MSIGVTSPLCIKGQIGDIPEEVMLLVFESSILSLKDLVYGSRTCKVWHRILQDVSLEMMYKRRLLPPCDDTDQEKIALENLTKMVAKLHLASLPNSSWMHRQHDLISRKYVIIIDNSLSMGQNSGFATPTYWQTAVGVTKTLVNCLGYLTPEGIYVWASEREETRSFNYQHIKNEADCEQFLQQVPLQRSASMAEAVNALFNSSSMKTTEATEIIILSDFEYPHKDMIKQLNQLKTIQEKRKKTWKPISFHLFTSLQTPSECFDKLLKYKKTKRLSVHEFRL